MSRAALNAKIQDLKSQDLKSQIKELAQTEFMVGSAALFEKYEELKSFGWQQYTPHFNDGDECVFRVHKEKPDINGYGYYDGKVGNGKNILAGAQKEIGWPTRKPNPDYDSKCAKIVEDVKAFLNSFGEDNYEEMFGDHVEVIVTRYGASVKQYCHE